MLELVRSCFRIDGSSPVERSVLAELPPAPCDDVILVTKAPAETQVIAELLPIDPGLRLVVMMRDPRDMIVSRHGLARDRYWANLRQWREAYDALQGLKNEGRVALLRYEDLVREPDAIQAAMVRRFPFLKPVTRFTEYLERSRPSKQSQVAMGGARPIAADRVGVWRRHKPRVAGQLQIHGSITKELIEFGYERDDRWLAELEGVIPDTTPSHWPEQYPVDERERRARDRAAKLAAYRQRVAPSS